MKVFVFDLLPYKDHLDDLESGKALPYPLGKSHFKASVAVETYKINWYWGLLTVRARRS